jgi:hypothetical protein
MQWQQRLVSSKSKEQTIPRLNIKVFTGPRGL